MAPYKISINNFRKTLLNHIKAVDCATEEQKEDVAKSMYEYIIQNKYVLEFGEHEGISQVIRDKLEDMHYNRRIPWASNYYLLLFGVPLVEDLNGIPDLIEIQN